MTNNEEGFYVCDWCGQEFTKKPYNYGGMREYCSKQCYLDSQKHGTAKVIKNE